MALLETMKKMGPSAIDIEIRSLGEDMGGSVELIQKFLQFILYILSTRRDFELANSYLALCLKLHSDTIVIENNLVTIVEQIKEVHRLMWTCLNNNFNKCLCVVSYLKSVT